MDQVEFGPLNIEIRAHETELLDEGFYQQLIQAPTAEAALKLLQGTPYEFLKSFENMDQQLMSYLQSVYQKAFELSPDKQVVEFASLNYVYHNLKVLFKIHYGDKDLSHLLIDIGRYPVADLSEAVNAGQSLVVAETYMHSINEVRDYLTTYKNIHHIDVLLDYFFLEHLMTLADAIGDDLLIQMIKEYIDLNAMIIAIRLSKMGKPVSNLSGLVPDVGTIPIQTMVDWAKDGYDSLSQAILSSSYRPYLAEHLDTQQKIDPINLEKILDDRRIELLQQAKFEVFGPRPILAFILAKETEIKNIRVIINGLLNELPKEIIESTLRKNYR